jgi:hypothetical protein
VLQASQGGAQVAASAAVRLEYAKLTEQEPTSPAKETAVARKPLEDCNICYDEFVSGDATVFCESSCGGNFHQACMALWLKQKRKERGELTCPLCRAQWPSDEAAKAGSSPHGDRSFSKSLRLLALWDDSDMPNVIWRHAWARRVREPRCVTARAFCTARHLHVQ